MTGKDHWLDIGVVKYGEQLITDTKSILNVLVIYMTLPIFWALHMQQSSRWVFQATKMNGDIGWYTIKPDQMIVLNSVLALFLIPAFEYILYPLLTRIRLKTSLQKMVLGAAMAGFAFVAAGVLELQIEKGFISILWMMPQFFIMVISEILFYTANINFTYTEAPTSMKAVMLACSYLTVAVGCLIVVLISGVAFFTSQAYEFIFFACIMFADTLVLGILAHRYKSTSPVEEDKKISVS